MSNKYYSYSSSVIYSNNNKKSSEEEIILKNDSGRIIKKKNGKIVQDKKINRKEFQKYLDDRELFIDDRIINNALFTFNNLLLPNLIQNPIYKEKKDKTYISKKTTKNKDIQKLKKLLTKKKGLTKKEIKYINSNLNKQELVKFMTNRYSVDKKIFNNMTKKQILEDLKHGVQKDFDNQNGGFLNGEPQPGFIGNYNNLEQKTLDFNFPEIIKNNNI